MRRKETAKIAKKIISDGLKTNRREEKEKKIKKHAQTHRHKEGNKFRIIYHRCKLVLITVASEPHHIAEQALSS